MNIFWAILLGVIQGLTEVFSFFSFGPLVFFSNIIFFFFFYHILLVVGTIPAAMIGFFFQNQLEAMFGSANTLGIELLITGLLNVLVDKAKTVKKAITPSNSFAIGIAQAVAIIPGISRSG